MKYLGISLITLALSISALASTNDEGFAALEKILPIGNYSGHNSYGEECQVTFYHYASGPYSFNVSSTDVRGQSVQIFVNPGYFDSYSLDAARGNFDAPIAETLGQTGEDGPFKEIVGSLSVHEGKTIAIQTLFGKNNCTIE